MIIEMFKLLTNSIFSANALVKDCLISHGNFMWFTNGFETAIESKVAENPSQVCATFARVE